MSLALLVATLLQVEPAAQPAANPAEQELLKPSQQETSPSPPPPTPEAATPSQPPLLDDSFFRNRPTAHSVEAGVLFGIMWFSADHNLQDLEKTARERSYQGLNTSPTVGVRFGYFPHPWVGAEIEGGFIPTTTPDSKDATIWTMRGHPVIQLPLAHIVPFAYGGAGVMALDSESLGSDTDPLWYFGAGLKLAVSKHLSFRIEARDNLMQRNRLIRTVGDGELEHSGELLGGAVLTLGRTD